MAKEADKRLEQLKKQRIFGYSFAAGMALLLAIAIWKDFHIAVKIVAASLCAFHLLGALLYPKALFPTFWFVTGLAQFIGNAITTIVFIVVFYLFYTPFSFFARLGGKDHIRNNSKMPHWLDVPEDANDPKRIEKLY